MAGPGGSFECVDVFITDELDRRAPKHTDYLREKLALQELAQRMAGDPDQVLTHLVGLAVQMGDAVSGGISLYEEDPAPGIFRWHYLQGTLLRFEGATTPRNFSPCGICLDLARPVLTKNPERFYTWLVDHGISLPEVLLVPLYVRGQLPLGTLWIVSDSYGHFDSGHARVMTELATFAGTAIRVLQTEKNLKLALELQETLTKEMGHRVKNLFAIADGMIRMTARTTSSTDEMSRVLSGRLHALASANALIRRNFAEKHHAPDRGADLAALVTTILRPYENVGHHIFEIDGPTVELGDKAINGLSLVLHELATNSAKYGALKADTGSLNISWKLENEIVTLIWQEMGGPVIDTKPTKSGFGTTLLRRTIVGQFGGMSDYRWQRQGLTVSISIPVGSLSH